MRKNKLNNPPSDGVPTGGELVTEPGTYELKQPIIMAGKDKVPGDKVKLNDRQAEWLKGSGHI